MAKSSKMTVLKNNGKSPLASSSLSSSKTSSPLMALTKKNYKKAAMPDQTAPMPGFGNTGMTGES